MKIIFYILYLVHMAYSFDLPRTDCSSDIEIDGQYYNLSTTIHMRDAYPTDAHFDVYGNLFFVKSGRNNEGFYSDIFVVEVKSNTAVKIAGLPESVSYSVAIDRKESQVYFGTSKGIYIYDYEDTRAKLYSDISLRVHMLFIDSDGNKYITQHNNGLEELYLLSGSQRMRLGSLEALDELAIGDNNDFYYIKINKLYVLKRTESKPIELFTIEYDGIGQITFHEDKIIIGSKSLIYFKPKRITTVKIVTHMPEKITAVAFNNEGNFIVGTHNSLLMFEKKTCLFRKSVGRENCDN